MPRIPLTRELDQGLQLWYSQTHPWVCAGARLLMGSFQQGLSTAGLLRQSIPGSARLLWCPVMSSGVLQDSLRTFLNLLRSHDSFRSFHPNFLPSFCSLSLHCDQKNLSAFSVSLFSQSHFPNYIFCVYNPILASKYWRSWINKYFVTFQSLK